jgi:hypothetical protein
MGNLFLQVKEALHWGQMENPFLQVKEALH